MANTRDYIAAGRAGSQGMGDIFEVTRRNSFDPRAIIEAEIRGRSQKEIAGIRAQRNVLQKGVAAIEGVQLSNIKRETESKVLDEKLNRRRKAGLLAGVGTLITGGAMLAMPRDNDDQSWMEKYYDAEDALTAEKLKRLEAEANRPEPERQKPIPFEFKPSMDYDADTGSTGEPAEVDTSAPTNVSVSNDFDPTKVMSKDAVRKTLDRKLTVEFCPNCIDCIINWFCKLRVIFKDCSHFPHDTICTSQDETTLILSAIHTFTSFNVSA